ncbi:MAG: hypothetical protein AB7N24_16015 [Dehalococcoidia bacterium]
MLHVSILTSDRSRDPELWATVWQGKAPPTLKILAVYNLASQKRLFVWEGEGRRDIQYIDRLNQVGVLETFVAFDQTAAGSTRSPVTSTRCGCGSRSVD